MIELYVYNVGNGDTFLIKFSDNSYGLIDINFAKKPDNSHPFIRRLKNKEGPLAFICITHYHKDHCQGLEWVLEEWGEEVKDLIVLPEVTFVVHEYLASKSKEYPFRYQDVKNAISTCANVPYKNWAINSDKYQCKIKTVWPPANDIIEFCNKFSSLVKKERNSIPDINDISIVLQINFGDAKLLFCADCPRKAYDSFDDNQALIKISHHGSDNNFHRKKITKKLLYINLILYFCSQ